MKAHTIWMDKVTTVRVKYDITTEEWKGYFKMKPFSIWTSKIRLRRENYYSAGCWIWISQCARRALDKRKADMFFWGRAERRRSATISKVCNVFIYCNNLCGDRIIFGMYLIS